MKVIPTQEAILQKKIYLFRGEKVMLDSDLAEIYGVETRVLNQAVQRNKERFVETFMFQLDDEEFEILKSQFVISRWGGRRTHPYVFTEHGVVMLASVLKSDIAIQASIKIVKAFVAMRHILSENAGLIQRMDTVEKKQLQNEQKIEKIFTALESTDIKMKQGIFYNGEMFDAYAFVSELIKKANKNIILIDGYVDDTVLTLLTKKKKNVHVMIYTSGINKKLQLDIKKVNSQYPRIELVENSNFHDRFIVIDESDLYHIGASLKDLGKKTFAFSKFETGLSDLLKKLDT